MSGWRTSICLKLFTGKSCLILPAEEILDKIAAFILARVEQNTFSEDFKMLYDRIIEPEGHQTKVEDMAKWLGYSTRYMSALFHRHLGMSPKKFLELARFNYALKVMDELDGDKKLAQVAHKVGYHDQAHFIRDFKKICGKTPKELSAGSDSLSYRFRFFERG